MLEMSDLWKVMNGIVISDIYVHVCMHANMCVQTCKLMQPYMLVKKDHIYMQADKPIHVCALKGIQSFIRQMWSV